MGSDLVKSNSNAVDLQQTRENEEKNYNNLNELGIDQEIHETNSNADTKSCELVVAPKEVRALKLILSNKDKLVLICLELPSQFTITLQIQVLNQSWLVWNLVYMMLQRN